MCARPLRHGTCLRRPAAHDRAYCRAHAGDVGVDEGRGHRVVPGSARLPKNKEAFLSFVDDIYKNDAYHSLSIEGYSVTPALIERVQRGDWDPENHEGDKKDRDALAARGYFQAFQSVKASLERIIAGENPGAPVRLTHKDWK